MAGDRDAADGVAAPGSLLRGSRGLAEPPESGPRGHLPRGGMAAACHQQLPRLVLDRHPSGCHWTICGVDGDASAAVLGQHRVLPGAALARELPHPPGALPLSASVSVARLGPARRRRDLVADQHAVSRRQEPVPGARRHSLRRHAVGARHRLGPLPLRGPEAPAAGPRRHHRGDARRRHRPGRERPDRGHEPRRPRDPRPLRRGRRGPAGRGGARRLAPPVGERPAARRPPAGRSPSERGRRRATTSWASRSSTARGGASAAC